MTSDVRGMPIYHNPDASGLLVCFPPVGAIGTVFDSWVRHLPARWELWSMSRPEGVDQFT